MANRAQRVSREEVAADTIERASSTKVTVACKVPNGLILRLMREETAFEPVMGGGSRQVQVYRPTGDTITLHGPAHPFGVIPSYRIIGGYALTPNVDAAFFATWLRQNKEHQVVKENLVFAYAKSDDAEAAASERQKLTSGLEPLNPEGDFRASKAIVPAEGRKPGA